MTDLAPQLRNELMNTVFAVESAVREVMLPDKINLASLGNMTPHLHWHVIPRHLDDKHFPNPIWGSQVRETRPDAIANIQARLSACILKKLNA
jgi:diadenosine tetraphosphate (Ap4A) HIT family hydrolase